MCRSDADTVFVNGDLPGWVDIRTFRIIYGEEDKGAMRIWSLHPKYLDVQGLVALWREGLLAQAVLSGNTKGYVHHPQLLRFREQSSPIGFIAEYLQGVHDEAIKRGYRFDASKINSSRAYGQLNVNLDQLQFEWGHLMEKLRTRDPNWHAQLLKMKSPQPHPLFVVVDGGIAQWEKGAHNQQSKPAPKTGLHP